MKNRSVSGYDLIAPFYDDLAGLVFGKPLFDAQTFFFPEIPDQGNVLILGGGSGWILPILFKYKPQVKICYIDLSEKMIDRAKKNDPAKKIDFIVGTEGDIPEHYQFDTVILNFYVDGFPAEVLSSKLEWIYSHASENAIWLVTDFIETNQRMHRFVLWLTHIFFGLLIQHPNKHLVQWWKVFERSGFKISKEHTWSNGLIKSRVYLKD